ncbi:uncharacterized protein LOC111335525 isoform X3 [Stylophora pistillata]|uniref:uncharacterized protein LOC111335525 isoform X3 n=1 Tax=Stylophora pistillata TaxID=50429 RepID=UPI000C0489C2|nr:uncharacterized protein LOC111335525 isoform X3 [Stylophora pistillata]
MKGTFEVSENLKNLSITLLVFVLLWMQPLIECRPTKCPLANNIAKYGPNGEIVSCVRCPNCPIGQGLSYACGSKVPNDSKIECVFCEPNKTYSDEHGIGHCKQCQDCGLRNVIQECSIYQKRECGNICPKGYVFHDNIEDCLELESEPSTSSSTHSAKDPSRRETTGTQLKTELADEVTTTASTHSDRITVSSSQSQFPSTGVNNTPTQESAEECIPLKNMSGSGESSRASVSSSTTQVDLADVTSQDKTKELLREASLDISTDNNIHYSNKEMSSHPGDA